jgi:beta-lactam-binding protein with PASTA domain
MRVSLSGVLGVLGVGWMCTACSLMKTSSSTTTPSGPSGPSEPSSSEPAPPPSAEYNGPDAYWVPDLMNKTRGDVEQLLRDQHFRGQVVATGDTDPKFVRDELACEQTPKFGKMAPTGTITVKYCNTYKKPDDGPELVGLTVEAAKQKAVAAGFTGKIEVMQLSDFDASCKEGNVCRVDPVRWYLNQEHEMQLMVNRKVSISTPDQ